MLRETVTEWTHQWLAEGKAQGLQEGEARMLTRQLEFKFGPLNAVDQQRIQQADAEELLLWGERLLKAESLSEVFGG